MKKLLNRTIFATIIFSFSYYNGYAQSLCIGAEQKAHSLLIWLVEKQNIEMPKRKSPEILSYKAVSQYDKEQYCKWCPIKNSPQLNMFINQKNQIWLSDNAREDQLIHELTHFLQSTELGNEEDETSTELETQAVYWQNKYKDSHIIKNVCE